MKVAEGKFSCRRSFKRLILQLQNGNSSRVSFLLCFESLDEVGDCLLYNAECLVNHGLTAYFRGAEMNLHRALSEISEIKAQLDRTQSYRGFRSLASLLSAFVVVAMAIFLNRWSTDVSISHFINAWAMVAVVSVAFAATEMKVRATIGDGNLHWKMHTNLGRQLLPSLVVGAAMTFVLSGNQWPLFSEFDPSLSESAQSKHHLLPSVWAMVYGLGLVACVQHLPDAARWVAAWFIVGGIACVALEQHSMERLNLQMAVLFGGGQILLGAVLFWNMERHRG